mgnify:CR=1 FL=1|tara:strand:+ start:111 stop:1565 length:1455 start_codon:yes stop_codon:yes gene_type:complete
MTFTPGSDEDRTDTIEAQRKGLGLDPETGEALDKNRTEREFYEASQGLRDANTAFQRFLGIVGALQNNATGIVGTIANSIGKDNSIVTPEQPIIEDVPQYPVVLQRILKVKKDNPEAFSGIVGSIGKDNNEMSDAELNELYKKRNNPDFYVTDIADPNYGRFIPDLEQEAEAKAKQKGEGDPTGIRSEQVFGNRSYWENLPKRSKNLFTKAGLTENDAIFFLSNFDKVTRDTAAAIQDPDYTSGTFELMKKELLPGFLEEMKDVKGLRPQLDHINQLAAALPLYDGTTFKEREQLNKIVIGEGIYAGHNPANLQYLDLRVHTVKSNYFNDLVGKNGEKFFGPKDLSTFEGKVKAAKEYAAIVKNSYKIVEDANKANKALYKQNLTPEEVTALLFEINPYTKYTIRDLKRIIEELKGVTQARSEANALDLMLTVREGMTPAEFFKMTGSGPRGQRKLPSLKKLKSAAFDDKYYQPLLDNSFNEIE